MESSLFCSTALYRRQQHEGRHLPKVYCVLLEEELYEQWELELGWGLGHRGVYLITVPGVSGIKNILLVQRARTSFQIYQCNTVDEQVSGQLHGDCMVGALAAAK